jgi:hypothetical protein
MSNGSSKPAETRALVTTTPAPAAGAPSEPAKTPLVRSAVNKQLSDLPRGELEALAEEYGLDPHDYKTPQHLIAALHERRQLIASMEREAMLDVIRWGRRPLPVNATNELIAQQIAKIKLMRFNGLSHRGLVILAQMRGLHVTIDDPIPNIIRRLKKQEGIFAKLNRKRRAVIGGWISNMIGESGGEPEYQFLPADEPAKAAADPSAGRSGTIKEEIEESGVLSGLTNRIKKTADSYLNQKLDEIEARIDRKLDEIDRRLAEWRDKEIANRIRILKITLWASVIVGAFSLIYAYVRANLLG